MLGSGQPYNVKLLYSRGIHSDICRTYWRENEEGDRAAEDYSSHHIWISAASFSRSLNNPLYASRHEGLLRTVMPSGCGFIHKS